MIIRTVLAVFALFPALVQAGAAAQEGEASLPQGGIITYIGNEGVLIDYGGAKFIIDGLYDDGLGDYVETPPAIRAAMLAGDPPYDGVTDLFVTHAHKDHYSPAALSEYLAAHPSVYALVPADLKVAGEGKETPAQAVLSQVVPLAGRDGEAAPMNYGANFAWTYLQMPHGGRQHFAYWFAIPPQPRSAEEAKAAGLTDQHLTVLHLGDTDDYPADLDPHSAFFADHPSDVALVPFWLLEQPDLAETLNADQLIGIHVPVGGYPSLDPDTMDWFSTPGEQRIIYKNMEE